MAYTRHVINICFLTFQIPALAMRTPELEEVGLHASKSISKTLVHMAPLLHLLFPGHFIIPKAAILLKLKICIWENKAWLWLEIPTGGNESGMRYSDD